MNILLNAGSQNPQQPPGISEKLVLKLWEDKPSNSTGNPLKISESPLKLTI